MSLEQNNYQPYGADYAKKLIGAECLKLKATYEAPLNRKREEAMVGPARSKFGRNTFLFYDYSVISSQLSMPVLHC